MIPVTREMLQLTELLVRLRQAEDRAHSTANLQQMLGNDPSVQHPPIWRVSRLFLFQGSLHLLSRPKKEHSMRVKQDPSTILSTGKRMDAMHKHCCSQFNSQGRM